MPRERGRIEPGERLILRFATSEVLETGDVRPEAIDLQGHSCTQRSRVASLDVVRTPEKPVLRETAPSRLPTHIEWTGGDNKPAPWEFFAVDDPTDEDDAHAEIRSRRKSRSDREEVDESGWKGKSMLKDGLRQALADALEDAGD